MSIRERYPLTARDEIEVRRRWPGLAPGPQAINRLGTLRQELAKIAYYLESDHPRSIKAKHMFENVPSEKKEQR